MLESGGFGRYAGLIHTFREFKEFKRKTENAHRPNGRLSPTPGLPNQFRAGLLARLLPSSSPSHAMRRTVAW
jgi:hypothetical protein